MTDKINALNTLKEKMESCQICGLAATRNNIVFGVGNPETNVMFVGEAPGEQEDLRGEPFVGRGGQLLDKMLLAAGFSRDDNIYIANIAKCRPSQNRDPAPNEINACLPFLREQVKIIRPKVIVCLGRIASQAIISPDFKVTKQHGEFYYKNSIWLMGTYHPAALLRFSAYKPDAFADLLALREKLAEL